MKWFVRSAASVCDINALAAADSYFVTLDLKQQFSELLRDPRIHIDESSRDMSLDVGNITTSSGYHEMPVKDDDFTVTWNTDGVPVYKSSAFSIWPLLLQVNELPIPDRYKHTFLAGL